MTKYRILYLAFFVFVLIMAIAYHSNLFSVLLVFAIIMPLVSMILVIISVLAAKIKIEYHTLTAEK